MPVVDLYYAESLLGHFTLILYDRVELIACRMHFVDKDAEAAHGGRGRWLTHKFAQFTGFANGKVLLDWKSSPNEFSERLAYEAPGRQKINSWQVSVAAMDRMLDWANRQVQFQARGHYGSYGYIVYSNQVDNCGSWTVKCLAEGGISIRVRSLEAYLQLPSVIYPNAIMG